MSNTDNGNCIWFSYVNKVSDIGFLEGDFLGVFKELTSDEESSSFFNRHPNHCKLTVQSNPEISHVVCKGYCNAFSYQKLLYAFTTQVRPWEGWCFFSGLKELTGFPLGQKKFRQVNPRHTCLRNDLLKTDCCHFKIALHTQKYSYVSTVHFYVISKVSLFFYMDWTLILLCVWAFSYENSKGCIRTMMIIYVIQWEVA